MDDALTLPAGAIDGHLSSDHPLAIRKALSGLGGGLTGRMVNYKPRDLWDLDTMTLPRAAKKARLRYRKFVKDFVEPRALRLDTAGHLPPGEMHPEMKELMAIAAEHGFFTSMLPWPWGTARIWEMFGSRGLIGVISVEELARGCGGLMLALTSNNLGMAPILLSGDNKAIGRFLLPAFKATKNGDPQTFAFAITEPGAGSDAEEGHGANTYKPGLVAKRADGGWILNGRKIFISGGDVAQYITVFSAIENEGMKSWTCFVVEKNTPGFKVARTELKMGMRASGAAELEFHDVFVKDSFVVKGLRKGWSLNRMTLNFSRHPVASMGVGLAQKAVDIATDFVCQQQLAGKPLINYQEIQLMLAQMIAETRSIRGMIYHDARSFSPRQANASLCKFQATDTAQRVAETAMDILGNHSVLHRNEAEKVFRDVRLTRIFEGTNQINRLAVIEDMQDELLTRMAKAEKDPKMLPASRYH